MNIKEQIGNWKEIRKAIIRDHGCDICATFCSERIEELKEEELKYSPKPRKVKK